MTPYLAPNVAGKQIRKEQLRGGRLMVENAYGSYLTRFRQCQDEKARHHEFIPLSAPTPTPRLSTTSHFHATSLDSPQCEKKLCPHHARSKSTEPTRSSPLPPKPPPVNSNLLSRPS